MADVLTLLAARAMSICARLQESELTPSGANLLDGRYAVFGYVVEGQDLLTQLQVILPMPSEGT